ncbi:uncharacterized protein F4812DRAFT_454531 [Daldinia caldariorum]|uniref:uncharacterized protein n=1 Tax=Daldinia caldariorum TaxID=326644 RepID=UPI00200764BC|nr:uncharacterized protein F4812DRAFT_454531 [Daldinia caldariorum]KAI1472718.1 hypothetical protein F4812DRAFT_454531 [Daldinia caldariorum]
MAMIQDTIKEDVGIFNGGSPRAKDMFEERRQYYLDLLGISVKELRKVMNTPEIELPPEEIFVEDVTRRVRPLTKRYLQRLVRLGRITKCDMDCIVDGGYTSVEAFYEDVYDHVGTFGAKKKETPADNSKSATQSIEIYDEVGFLVKQEGGADQDDKHKVSKDDDSDPQKKSPERESTALSLGSGGIIPPIKLEAPTEIPDDEESDEEEQASSDESDPEPAEQDPPSEDETPLLDAEGGDSDSSDGGSSVECHVDDKEITMTEIENADSDSDESDVSSVFESSPGEEDSITPDAEKAPQPFLAALPRTNMPTNDDDDDDDEQGDIDVDYDELLDVWLPSHKMFYWQYEIIYAAILTAFRYRERFQSARDAYKVDPFADWE